MELNVNTVETDQEVGENVSLCGSDVRKESADEDLASRELNSMLATHALLRQRLQLTGSPTAIRSLSALASTSPTSTPPSLQRASAMLFPRSRNGQDSLGEEDPVTLSS